MLRIMNNVDDDGNDDCDDVDNGVDSENDVDDDNAEDDNDDNNDDDYNSGLLWYTIHDINIKSFQILFLQFVFFFFGSPLFLSYSMSDLTHFLLWGTTR